MAKKDPKSPKYIENLRVIKSLLVVSDIQKKRDIYSSLLIESYKSSLKYEPLDQLRIGESAWKYIQKKKIKSQLVFCHPDILIAHPEASLYYRCMCGLSIKVAKEYNGAIEGLENGNPNARIDYEKAIKMSQTYNFYICKIIVNSTNWSLDDGYRTILATMGITLDGIMRNKVGDIGEDTIRQIIVEWLIEQNLIIIPELDGEKLPETLPNKYELKDNIFMYFSSEPDIYFKYNDALKVTIEIKGGIDPAGAQERYGAAKKSFQKAVNEAPQCENFYIGGVFTVALNEMINSDRLVHKTFNLIKLITNEEIRNDFFLELFHHSLRMI